MPLVFDTTRPHSMIPVGDEVTVRDGAPPKGPTHVPDGIHYSFYIHGQAEDDLGFDIPVIIEGEMPSVPGIYDCVINSKPSKLYLWIPEGDERVAVFGWDEEGNFIRKCYKRPLWFTVFCKPPNEVSRMRGLAIYADDEESRQYCQECMDERRDLL